MYYEDYREFLNSPEWQRKREKVKARAMDHCESCLTFCPKGDVHHKDYSEGWNCRTGNLLYLCRECHLCEHKPSWSDIHDMLDDL